MTNTSRRTLLIIFALFLAIPGSWLLLTRPTQGQESKLRIFFVHVGQGHSALIVSPEGRSLLIDGGPEGAGAAEVVPLMHSLGLTRIDYMVASHYHSDHIGGLDEVASAFPVGVAFDRGDLAAPSTFAPYRRYIQAVGSARRTITPGTEIDLGGGVIATCLVTGGRLISGGDIPILSRNDQLDQLENSASIGLLIQFGDFDALICGDLTGGGINTTDLESVVAQLAGDVDLVQLNHHGSRTSGNTAFLQTLRAEVGIVQMGSNNEFFHPSLVVTDRFINGTPTNGQVPPAPNFNVPVERVPFFIQNQLSPNSSSVSQQGLVAGGHIEIATDGATYVVGGGVLHPITMATDGAGRGVRRDFPPSVRLRSDPLVPAARQPAAIFVQASDDSTFPARLEATVEIDGGSPIILPVQKLHEANYRLEVPGQVDGARVEVKICATDDTGGESRAVLGYFAGVTPIARCRSNDSLGEVFFEHFPVRISGTVTVGSGSFSVVQNDIYVEDGSGGIHVQEYNSISRAVAAGDQVTVLGRLGQSGGETFLDSTNPFPSYPFEPGFGFAIVSPGSARVPAVESIGSIGEATEGRLVRIDNVRIASGTIRVSGSSNLRISDGTGSLTLRIESATGIPGMVTPNQPFSIIGVIGQFDSFRPFSSGYQISPRSRSDLLLASTP
ncbi:MAG: MBL fold metallo-hydrolase [Acidobacteria bacterium]|nr:MBL fold metallo-hydrolase [Acidobacteriota bacterium]